jgi:hypothetical protein
MLLPTPRGCRGRSGCASAFPRPCGSGELCVLLLAKKGALPCLRTRDDACPSRMDRRTRADLGLIPRVLPAVLPEPAVCEADLAAAMPAKAALS